MPPTRPLALLLLAGTLALLAGGALPGAGPSRVLAGPPAPADAALAAACRESFGRVKAAVEARSAAAVVACMEPEGTLAVALQGLPSGGPMKREQATRVLGSYFALVSEPRLVERPGQAADSLVRSFDYTRRLRGGDPATTRLVLTLRRDARGSLRLASLSEAAR